MERYGRAQPFRRLEDERFLTGRGRYVDDLAMADMVHAAFLRSPHAHAEILSVDADAARRRPGVVAVYTGADWRDARLPGIPIRAALKNRDGSAIVHPDRPALAQDRVRHVGECVAMVLATTRQAAIDAADEIDVDYRPLAAVTDQEAAIAPRAPRVHAAADGNLCFDWDRGDPAAVEAAMAKAAHRVGLRLINNRLIAHSLEPRGALCRPDGDGLLLTGSIQNVFTVRQLIAVEIFGWPAERLRVRAADVGGGFGCKNQVQPEHVMTVFAADRLGRPVKWIDDRADSFIADAQGRDQVTEATLALDKDGKMLALSVKTLANLGAYLSTNGPAIPTGASAQALGGAYDIAAIHLHVRGIFTNTVPTDAYRGAGRPEAAYSVERLIDVAARRLEIDPAELRRRNFIPPKALPYTSPLGRVVREGDFAAVLDQALALADRAGFEDRAAAARRQGRRLGLGIACYLEATLGTPSEYARLVFDSDGGATLYVGTQSNGQGHETVFAEIVAGHLGIAAERVRLVQADTGLMPLGGGHGGSRSLQLGGAAVLGASERIVEKGRLIAAHLLEVAPVDLVYEPGRYLVAGTDREVTMAAVIESAFGPLPPEIEPGLEADARYEREAFTFPNGCHVAEVAVDPATGVVEVLRHTVVDDFGTVVNPTIARGQVQGGIAQGAGQALFEHVVYDGASGQLLSGSPMDYALPRAGDLPAPAITFFEGAPATTNPLGVKGCGEAGTVGAPPAIVNAVVDALTGDGVRHIDMPLTPERVWRAIGEAAEGRRRK